MIRTSWLPRALLCAVLVACSPGPADQSEYRSGAAERRSTAAPNAESGRTSGGEPTMDPSPRLPDELAATLADGPREAASAGQVVDQIVAAERAIARRRTPPDVLAAAGHLQQVAYRELAGQARWDDRVRAALPGGLLRVVRLNVASRRDFRSMHPVARSELGDTLPAWRIVRPAPARRLLAHYREAEGRFGVGWEYLAAINLVETGMGRIRGTSVAGARGPMQFIPSTWAAYGEGDINSPRDSILAAGRYLEASGFGTPGGRRDALYSYNNSDAYVRGVSRLAEVMQRRPRAFHGYYHWQIYYLTSKGSIWLPEGYHAAKPIPVKRWLANH